MVDQDAYERLWDAVALRLLHPTQLLIIEALWRIGEPLSATQIKNLYANGTRLGSWDYHCKRLASLDLLDGVQRLPKRGAWENFYALKTD